MRRSARKALGVAKSTPRLSRPVARSFATVRDRGQKDPAELDQVTELPNGVRVATESLPGPFSGVGVYIDAGSRYESESLRGTSHIIDRLAFQSTKRRTADQMLEAVETLGGNIQCHSSREALMYQSATFNLAVPSTVGLLAETIRDPTIADQEIQQQIETADYEIQEIWAKPELIIQELVHLAAYKDNTLGNPLLCPKERLPFITKGVIEKYREILYRPERMVVAFAGVQHPDAVRLTEEYFGDMKRETAEQYPSSMRDSFDTSSTSSSDLSSASSSPPSSLASSSSPTSPIYSPPSSTSSNSSGSNSGSKILSKLPLFKNLSTSALKRATVSPLDPNLLQPSTLDLSRPSHYTGGFLSLPPLPHPANQLSMPLSHVHLAFEAPPVSSPDIYALATLQTLLGGGGSFSAGGPGKGMYSRLYRNVLNQHDWIESCVAFNNSFSDSGLFGIAASCSPGRVGNMIDVMCHELHSLALDTGYGRLQTGEVNRAKNQLRSSLLMNLESRLVELEDLGRQVQIHGRKVPATEMCRRIDELTVDDLRRVARSVLTGLVDNAGHGTGAPTVVIQEAAPVMAAAAASSATKLAWNPIEWQEVQDRIARWKLGRL